MANVSDESRDNTTRRQSDNLECLHQQTAYTCTFWIDTDGRTYPAR